MLLKSCCGTQDPPKFGSSSGSGGALSTSIYLFLEVYRASNIEEQRGIDAYRALDPGLAPDECYCVMWRKSKFCEKVNRVAEKNREI